MASLKEYPVAIIGIIAVVIAAVVAIIFLMRKFLFSQKNNKIIENYNSTQESRKKNENL